MMNILRPTLTRTTCLCPELVRSFAVTGRHSKNVAGKKNKLDAMKAKLFTRLGVKLLMAAKAGGPDPQNNVELARALKEAHAVKLPKENIERALKKATEHSGEAFTLGLYEVFGHGGVGLVVAALSDNPNRVNLAIKTYAKKNEIKMASSGSVLFQFDHKAVFTPQTKYDKDAVIEKAIECDIDDISFLPNINHLHHHLFEESEHKPEIIVAGPDQLGTLHDIAERLNLHGTFQQMYLPKELITVNEKDFETNMQLIEGFESLDEIDAVFHNMNVE